MKILVNIFAWTLIIMIVRVRGNRDDLHLTFEVDNNEQFCLYQKFNVSIEYVVEYGVVKGGNFDIDFLLESPGNLVLYNVQRSNKLEAFKFMSSNMGDFKFCFSNDFSQLTHKLVYFSLRPANPKYRDTLRQEAGREQPGVLTATEFRLEHLHARMENVSGIQQFYRIQELVDRNFADMLNSKIQTLSLVNSLTILAVSIAQVFVLKYLFNKKPNRSGGPYQQLIVNNNLK